MSLAVEDQETPQTRYMDIMGIPRHPEFKAEFNFPQKKETPMHRFKVILGTE
jgi:hypothetical protein